MRYEEVQRRFEKEGYWLLFGEYKNAKSNRSCFAHAAMSGGRVLAILILGVGATFVPEGRNMTWKK
jgi:hypothetical protein